MGANRGSCSGHMLIGFQGCKCYAIRVRVTKASSFQENSHADKSGLDKPGSIASPFKSKVSFGYGIADRSQYLVNGIHLSVMAHGSPVSLGMNCERLTHGALNGKFIEKILRSLPMSYPSYNATVALV